MRTWSKSVSLNILHSHTGNVVRLQLSGVQKWVKSNCAYGIAGGGRKAISVSYGLYRCLHTDLDLEGLEQIHHINLI